MTVTPEMTDPIGSLTSGESRPDTPTRFAKTLRSVCDKIAPVWALEDYVAINPYAGFSSQTLTECHLEFRKFSEGSLLMPVHYYAAMYRDGKVTCGDIANAIERIAELAGDETVLPTMNEITFSLDQSLLHGGELVEFGTQNESPEGRWGTAIIEEISRHCSAHFDLGQAVWLSPFRGLSLYDAWREIMRRDRKFEWMGIKNFRSFVSELPASPDEAILSLLMRLNVPESNWETFLLSRAFTVPGWSACAKYQGILAERAGGVADQDLIGLLAIRLAYDVALEHPIASFNDRSESATKDVWIRTILLRASELAIQDVVVGSLLDWMQTREQNSNRGTSQTSAQPLAQMAFCIDVRSERFRRHLEASLQGVQTLGFAGFFGLPIEFVSLGQTQGVGQVPVLLTPAFKVYETVADASPETLKRTIRTRHAIRSWRKGWKKFATSAVGCFPFVETTGWLSAGSLLGRTLRIGLGLYDFNRDGVDSDHKTRITLDGLEQQGVTIDKQIEMATAVLTNMGITKNFAKLVVFCGHAASTHNNPLQAGLDCGACGGHSGESNARFAAMMINQPAVRAGLARNGIVIPQDTHFLPALHNTTTDEIVFFDISDVPDSRVAELEMLRSAAATATGLTRAERMPLVSSDTVGDLLRRSKDWSEVRPEWGLAGNATFIAAPRRLTETIDLQGRAFLHSYDESTDPDANVLETIMTAPLIVAHLINMQYYASTVDNTNFGSGSKTVHNVVGGFGVLSGNGGDLQTGLPIQSLHNGSQWVHEPVRLLGILAARRSAIEGVLAKHAGLRESIVNGWMNLIAIQDGHAYRYDHTGEWQSVA